MASQRRLKMTRGETRVTELLHSLCSLHAQHPSHIATLYTHVLAILESGIAASCVIEDEFKLSERIQKKLVREQREKDAVTFLELHQRLTNQKIIKQCGQLLSFLLTASDEDRTNVFSGPFHGGSLLLSSGDGSASGMMGTLPAPTPPHHPSSSSASVVRTHNREMSSSLLDTHTTLIGSSGIGTTLGSSSHMTSHSTMPPNQQSTLTTTPLPQFHSTPQVDMAGHAPSTTSHAHLNQPREAWSESTRFPTNDRVVPNGYLNTKRSPSDPVSEAALLRDVLFVFQNIDGKYIHFNSKEDAFRIDKKVQVISPVRDIVHRLCEVGWLFRKVKTFIDTKTQDKTAGLVCQSFCSALSDEVTEYYRLVAVLEAQLQDMATVARGESGRSQLTLRRLIVWTHDPLQRLKYLAILVGACKGQKGGALVSTLHSYSYHGDPYIHTLVTRILTKVYQPLNTLLNSWIFDGELIDSFSEFIISCDFSSKPEKLWRSKYKLRKTMIPSFISQELAEKILIIGKSINFLRQVCHDHTPLWTPTLRHWFMTDKGEVTFSSMTGSSLKSVVAQTYLETSRHLLQIMHTKYSFGKHLQAVRKYLLLGQGDFIRHLMDLLASELSKPATSLYLHNLTGTLETAIRATNAQFEDPNILKRLDVQKLQFSPGDQGWDVFSLQYHVDGPISTVFTAENMLVYLKVFNFLWRAKRVQYYLSHMWNEQTAHYHYLHTIPELSPILHECHLLLSAMVHFISQLQYYINFEVMECNWDGLLKKVGTAQDLDQIITAHDTFLEHIIAQCLLDSESQPLLSLLRMIFDIIVSCCEKQAELLTSSMTEFERRREWKEQNITREKQGVWGVSEKEEEEEEATRVKFTDDVISSLHSQFVILHELFKDKVVDFMHKLTAHSEQKLRYLCFRLDFNEYYSSSSNELRSTSFIRKMK